MECKSRGKWSLQTHRQAADEIFEEIAAAILSGMIMTAKNETSDVKTMLYNENYEGGLLQVRQLGMFDFAIDLRERFFSAHGQHGMAQANKDRPQA